MRLAPARDVQQEPHPGQQHRDARRPRRHERQRHAGQRCQPEDREGVQQRLGEDERRDAGRDELRVGRLGRLRGAQPAVGDHPVEEHQDRHADDAQLLADHREDEVRVGLGQVEDLLHRLARAQAEQPARTQRDLPLHRLEARVGGMRPGVQERRQPRAAVGLEQREQEDEPGRARRQRPQVAHRHARRDEHRRHREPDDERGPQVRLRRDEQRRRARDQQERADDPLERLQALRLPREQPRCVEDERELHDLAGLELQRAGPQPPLRAVDLHAQTRELHCDQQHEGDDEQDRGEALRELQAAVRHDLHQDEAQGPVHEVLHEVGRAVAAALEQRPGRRGAVDHHRAAGHEAERRGEQDLVLERIRAGRATPGPLHAPELRRARTSSLNARPRAS